ncbi:hypothetical protein INR49_030004 [Caranx melampygus]|nr:hypothetical protein INR49_030004 [Caranx melampygus]
MLIVRAVTVKGEESTGYKPKGFQLQSISVGRVCGEACWMLLLLLLRDMVTSSLAEEQFLWSSLCQHKAMIICYLDNANGFPGEVEAGVEQEGEEEGVTEPEVTVSPLYGDLSSSPVTYHIPASYQYRIDRASPTTPNTEHTANRRPVRCRKQFTTNTRVLHRSLVLTSSLRQRPAAITRLSTDGTSDGTEEEKKRETRRYQGAT